MSSPLATLQSPAPNADVLLHEVLDALAEGVAMLGPSGEVAVVNQAWVDLGPPRGACHGTALVGEDYPEACARATGTGADEMREAALAIRRLLNGEIDHFALEYPCDSPTGECRYRMSVRRVSHPGLVSAIVTLSDRTMEHRAALEASEARLRTEAQHREADHDRRRLEATLEAIPIGVWLSDPDGRIRQTNSAAVRVWGGEAPLAEHQGDYAKYGARWPVSGAPVLPEEWPISRTLASGEPTTSVLLEIDRFDGTSGYTLNSAALIHDAAGTVIGALATSVDVTEREALARERERLVASLERERQQLASVFHHAPAFLAVLRGPDFVFELLNATGRQLVGHRDVIGKRVADALPELASQGFLEILEEVRATGEPWTGSQIPVMLSRTPGAKLETRYVDLVYQRLTDPDGGYSLVSHGVDVTEQVVATDNLRRNEQRLREQFAKLPVPTYLWEERGDDFVLLDCNESALAALPQFGADAFGRTSRDLFPGMDELTADVRRCLGDNVVVRRSVDVDLGPVMGRRRFDITLGPQQPDRVLLHAVDMTDRAELEAQLRQAQKMDAVGRLAGGVAHDFNNLLTVIGAHSAFLLESLDSGDPRREDVVSIHNAGIRAAGLTRQLLAFSRKQILKPDVIDLNATVRETRKMLGRLLGEDIGIATTLAADVPHVVADPSQIDQVLMNLALNARDAMPSGGRITITTALVAIPADTYGARRIVPAGEYASITVRDEGMGMDEAIQARLFEPFFTTKEPGKGTGLGLATVYGIVKQSGGYILVESAPGQGSTFTVYLPAVAREHAREQLQDAARAVGRGVETVLLVEDEPGVREVAKRVLRREGYVVLEAANGQAALTLSLNFDSPIHLVVSDVVMPGMRGGEVVRRLQDQRPGLKALFMSGYTDDDVVRRGIGSSAVPFVQKPFSARDLARAVREALEG